MYILISFLLNQLNPKFLLIIIQNFQIIPVFNYNIFLLNHLLLLLFNFLWNDAFTLINMLLIILISLQNNIQKVNFLF